MLQHTSSDAEGHLSAVRGEITEWSFTSTNTTGMGMAWASISYQTKDFGEKGVWILGQKLWSQCKSINLQRVPMEVNTTIQTVCTLRVHGEYRTDLDSSGTMGFRTVIPAQWWWATSRAVHGCWNVPRCSWIPTSSLGHREGHGPYTVFTNSHRALELQVLAKLSSWLSSSSML